MSAAAIHPDGSGRLQVSGELSLRTVPQLLAPARELIGSRERIDIDLGGVSHADSAGVALLVEWMREARQAGKEIRFLNIPRQMLAIARVSSLDGILPLARD